MNKGPTFSSIICILKGVFVVPFLSRRTSKCLINIVQALRETPNLLEADDIQVDVGINNDMERNSRHDDCSDTISVKPKNGTGGVAFKSVLSNGGSSGGKA